MDETGSEAREQQLKTSLFLSGAIPKLGGQAPGRLEDRNADRALVEQ
jgi:hypothetical protein